MTDVEVLQKKVDDLEATLEKKEHYIKSLKGKLAKAEKNSAPVVKDRIFRHS